MRPDRKEAMKNVLNKVLFGKYEIISLLGSGNFGSVYLSRHLTLECYRAIKFIPKDNAIDSLFTEANLLKSLQHPGIPTIYDMEQDENYYYLIEEYAQGESLEEFLLHQPTISQSTFFDLSLQLCDIFRYLHTLKPYPLLYLDLKPEHIIVCGMQIKLIDFGVSTYLSNLGNIYNLFGNKDFSAPELLSGASPDILSDIYSIGKIMELLSHHLDIPLSPKLHSIINKSIEQIPASRFETVDKLISAIENEKETMYHTHSRKNIAVIGSHLGCGSTHICIALVSTLNYLGYRSFYYQIDHKDSLQQVPLFVHSLREKDGLISYRFFKGYPSYGPGVQISEADADIYVYDYGATALPEDFIADELWYICSSSIWHRYSCLKKGIQLLNSFDNLKIICNMGQKNSMYDLSKHFSKSIYNYPYDTNPFSIDKSKITFVSSLLSIKRRRSLFFHLKNILFPKK